MSEYVSIGDSVIITLFSIAMVFIVLVVISIFISLLKHLDGKEDIEVSNETKVATKSKENVVKTKIDNTVDEEELVAVISAAVAASLGVKVPEINIKKINRISGNSPAWSTAGREEYISSKL